MQFEPSPQCNNKGKRKLKGRKGKQKGRAGEKERREKNVLYSFPFISSMML